MTFRIVTTTKIGRLMMTYQIIRVSL